MWMCLVCAATGPVCMAVAQHPAADRAGVPPDNATFFCDYQRIKCYSHNFRQAGYQGAVDACVEAQGELLHIGSAAEQQLVEQVRGLGPG